MNNKRWDSQEKIELMKLYSEGCSFDDIGKKLNRSPNAIKLRMEGIVYDNLAKGKSPNLLVKMLNTTQDTIKQFYYSHKSFKQSKGEPTIDVNFTNTNPVPSGQPMQTRSNQLIRTNNQIGGFGQMASRPNVINQNASNQVFRTAVGGNVAIDRNVDRIEKENHVLESIIKNYRMKRQIRKLYATGKLDEKSIKMYEQMIKNSH
jgi:hypothetical protein